MSEYIHARELSAGQILFREGEMGDNAYIVEHGEIEISVGDGDCNKVIASLGRGEIVGEMALIGDTPRSATARAVGAATLLVLRRNRLMQPIEKTDPLIRLVIQILTGRLEESAREKTGRARSPEAERLRQSTLDEVRDQTLRHISTERELRRAIENDHFSLHYQPIVRISDGLFGGTEALMRWHHPENGFISPGDFIPLAEETGMIVELGRWAMQQGLREHQRVAAIVNRPDTGIQPPFVSINVSAAQLVNHSEVVHLADIIEGSGTPPSQIKLELTESLLVSDPKQAASALGLLKETGIKLSIDDFGTGYSSLSYLHQFPFDTLKIDRAFVSRMVGDRASQRLVRSIVKMAAALEMETVAEGIEHHTEVDALNDMNCLYGQGYLLARPMPATDLERLLGQRGSFGWVPNKGIDTEEVQAIAS